MSFILIIFLYLISGPVYFDYIKSKKTSHRHFPALFEDVWKISPPASMRSFHPGLILENFQNLHISLLHTHTQSRNIFQTVGHFLNIVIGFTYYTSFKNTSSGDHLETIEII